MGTSVGIVTMVGNFNFGNRLQNYAVSKIYETLGCDSETLVYPGVDFPSALRNMAANILLPHEATHPEERMSAERKASFQAFTSLIPTRQVDATLDQLREKYDYFSVGSDQVWNPNYVDCYRWMFLQFAERGQRIALSPSIGVSSLSSPYARRRISRGLRGFDNLSVREADGAKLIKQLTGQDATVLIDPTLMVTANSWRSVANGRMVPDRPYVFTYLLGDRSVEQDAYISAVSDDLDAIQVSLSDKARDGEVDAGPAEFIALIDGASRVITDSYHAAVFSILMDTPVTIFRREGRSNLFSRLATLTQTFGLQDAVFGDERFEGQAMVSAQVKDSVLAKERRRFAEHVRQSMPGVDVEVLANGI